MEFTNNLADAEEFDKLKTKVLKFVLYKKRTENEVREKFEQEIDENKLEDIIEILKENNYINDKDYIDRSIKEFKALMKHTADRREFIDRPLSYYENIYDVLAKEKTVSF